MSTIDEELKLAARVASEVVADVMREHKQGEITDEDDITPWLAKGLKERLNGYISGLYWSAGVVRHRGGSAAEEKRTGADIIIHYRLNTHNVNINKGVLIQAKRAENDTRLSTSEYDRLQKQKICW